MSVFDLEAVIKLTDDGFRQGLNKAKQAVGTFAKISGAALAAGSAAVGKLASSSVKAYANYEQLAGGVKKLFGDSASEMMKFAQDAYRTAGMSANDYMDQATSFAAALIQSYEGDTSRAAKQADKAMRAISDNFNTFGGDIQGIKSAFQGFAKQNYTMLDNLKLGYGGTKTEMERLIADANEYAESIGQASDLSIENFGDIVEAIDLIQQKQNIAGTTAKEAATTISGALGMVKAAWQNLLVAFSDKDADLGAYFSRLADSVVIAFQNIVPVFGQALLGIGQTISKLTPIITEQIPLLMANILPTLLSAATSLVGGLISAMPGILQGLWDAILVAITQIGGFKIGKALIKLESVFKSAFGSIASTISERLGKIDIQSVFDGVGDIISGVADAISFLTDQFSTLAEPLGNVASALGDLFAPAVESVVGVLSGVDFKALIADGFAGAAAIIQGVADAIQFVSDNIGTLASVAAGAGVTVAGLWLIFNKGSMLTSLARLIINGSNAFAGLAAGASKAFAVLAANPIAAVITVLAGLVAALITAYNTNDEFRAKVDAAWSAIKSTATAVFGAIGSFISSTWNSIKSTASSVWASITSTVSSAWGSIKSGVSNGVNAVRSAVSSGFSSIVGVASSVWNSVKSTISNAINGAKAAVQSGINAIKSAFNVSLSFPKIKLPHFAVNGKFSLSPPSVPRFSVSWNKKALDDPYMFSNATIFGAGEAGDEVLYGRSNLMSDIRDVNAESNAALAAKIDEILVVLAEYLPQAVSKPVMLDGKALVGAIGADMDGELGDISLWRGRGLSMA